MKRRMRTVVTADPNAGLTKRHRVPLVLLHINDLLGGFIASYLEKGDLSYSFFCYMWKLEDMPSLHTCCPSKFDIDAYLQIIFFVLLEQQLFLDFSSVSSNIIPLKNISFQEVRTLVSLVPVIYSLFTVYHNQHYHHRVGDNSKRSDIVDSFANKYPIRITLSKYAHLQAAVTMLRRCLPGVGEDIYLIWCHLSQEEPAPLTFSLELPTLHPPCIILRGAFVEAAYCGPVSTYFAERHHLLTLQQHYSASIHDVNPALPWSNITNWKESLTDLGLDTVRDMITAHFQDSDREKRTLRETQQPNETQQETPSSPSQNTDNNVNDDNNNNDDDDKLISVSEYIALRLQIIHETIVHRKEALLTAHTTRQHDKQRKEAQRIAQLRQKCYAYEEPLRLQHQAKQRAQAERDRQVQVQWQLLHEQQQQQQQKRDTATELWHTDNINSAMLPITVNDDTSETLPVVDSSNVPVKQRKAKKLSVNTHRIASLLDDLEAQIAAVTCQYDPHHHLNLPMDKGDTSDSEDDRDIPSFLADLPVLPAKRSRQRTSTVATPLLSLSATQPSSPPEHIEGETADLSTLTALESLIASVSSQYTSSSRRGKKTVSTSADTRPTSDINDNNKDTAAAVTHTDTQSHSRSQKLQPTKTKPSKDTEAKKRKTVKNNATKSKPIRIDMADIVTEDISVEEDDKHPEDNLRPLQGTDTGIPESLENLLAELEDLTAGVI